MFFKAWILTAPYFLFMPTYLSYSMIWFFIKVSFWDIYIESVSCLRRFSPIWSTTVFLNSTSSFAYCKLFYSSTISSFFLSISSSFSYFSSYNLFLSWVNSSTWELYFSCSSAWCCFIESIACWEMAFSFSRLISLSLISWFLSFNCYWNSSILFSKNPCSLSSLSWRLLISEDCTNTWSFNFSNYSCKLPIYSLYILTSFLWVDFNSSRSFEPLLVSLELADFVLVAVS